MNQNPLIVALDVPTFKEARDIIDSLENDIETFKVGSQLFTACGPAVIRYILAKNKQVFLDLKYHDIPNTVANAVTSVVGLGRTVSEAVDEQQQKIDTNQSVFMLTVHTQGGPEMLQRAVQAATKEAENIKVTRPLIVGITVLTSDKACDNIQNVVIDRARMAYDAGLDGVVASSQEAEILRREFGDKFIIVTPGIRPKDSDVGDQKRVTTPSEAISNGSNYLVVGRPIVKAENPSSAAQSILEEIYKAKKD